MKRVKANIEVLSKIEIEKIHSQSLKILAEIGLKVPDKACLHLLKQNGCVIDNENFIAKFPAEVIEDMIKKQGVKQRNRLTDVAPLEGWISTQMNIVEYPDRNRRLGTCNDILKGIALTEHLPNICNANSVVIPHEINSEITDIESFKLIYTYSTKPGGTYILSPQTAPFVVEMMKVRGKCEPYLLDTVSPLQFSKTSLEIAKVFANAGLPVMIGILVMTGASGPVTLAGAIALQNAEALASMFLVKCLTGDMPNHSGSVHSIDLKTSLCSFGSPNQALVGLAIGQMCKQYGFNTNCNAGLSDSLLADFQCGFEKASSAILNSIAGVKGIGAQGIVGADQGFSFEQLVIDNEWISAYNYILKGIEISDETLAYEVIKELGIGGQFLTHEHTLMCMETNYWDSQLFDRVTWEQWIAMGGKSVNQKAHEFVNDVTQGFEKRLPVIPDKMVEELAYIAEKARKSITK